jgi:hypothetical protein
MYVRGVHARRPSAPGCTRAHFLDPRRLTTERLFPPWRGDTDLLDSYAQVHSHLADSSAHVYRHLAGSAHVLEPRASICGANRRRACVGLSNPLGGRGRFAVDGGRFGRPSGQDRPRRLAAIS